MRKRYNCGQKSPYDYRANLVRELNRQNAWTEFYTLEEMHGYLYVYSYQVTFSAVLRSS